MVENSTLALESFTWLSLGQFWRTQERLCMTRVRSLLSMRGMFLRYSFGPRPNDSAPATAGSLMTIGLSIKVFSHPKNQFDERKQDWLVQDMGLRWGGLKAWRDSGMRRASFSPPCPRKQKEALTVECDNSWQGRKQEARLKKKCYSESICWSRRGAQRSSHMWYKMRSRWLELQVTNCICYTLKNFWIIYIRQIHFKTVVCDFSLSLFT